MNFFIKSLYNVLVIPLLLLSVKLYALVNKKAREREENCITILNSLPEKSGKRILFHAASMGEFEQVKYLIELIRERDPDVEIVVSFFSPSGFVNLKDKTYYDHKLYLPIDTRNNAKEFAKIVDPDLVIIIRYDLWLNFIRAFKKKNVPLYLINATYTRSKAFGKKMLGRNFYKLMLNNLNKIYTINKSNYNSFKLLNIKSEIEIAPDTRYDRVLKKVGSNSNNFSFKFPEDNYILIAGSSWKKDEEIIAESVEKLRKNNFKISVIYVPHEPSKHNIERLKKDVKSAALYSEVKNSDKIIEGDLIVDEIGLLLDLYRLGDIAYIGGGFGAGVHSVIEPAGYGMPVICGNTNIEGSIDAIELRKKGGVVTVKHQRELYKTLRKLLENREEAESMGEINQKYLQSKSGSSERIYKEISGLVGRAN